MKYQLGTVIFEEIGGGYYLASLPTRTIKLALFELLAMRAAPIDDKPECGCEKTSNEWKIYSLNSDGQCIHCGRQISHKQEKIEKLRGKGYAEGLTTLETVVLWIDELVDKQNEIIDWINNHESEE